MEFILAVINSGVISNINGYYILAFFEIILYQILARKRIFVNSIGSLPFWMLAISGLIYAFAARTIGQSLISGMVLYFILPVLIYMSGYAITNSRRGKAVLTAERCLAAIAVGCGIHVVLNITANIGISNRAATADFFTGGLAATNLGSLNTYILALLPCLLVTKRKKVRVVGLVLFALSVVYIFILGTRTQPYALIIMLVISAVIDVKRHYGKRLRFETILKWLSVAALLIIVAWVAYSKDIGGIRTKILMSNLLYRFNENARTASSDATRFTYFKAGLWNLINNPFGGNHSGGIHYYHNYWLDIGRVAGTLPVILVATMDIIFVVHMLKIFKDNTIDEDFRYALLGIYICVFLNFFMEPIMDGYLDLFYRFTLINGMVEGMYALPRRSKRIVLSNEGTIFNNSF